MDNEPEKPTDAWLTAAPNEPTWTLQGGDPLAAPLLRFWAQLARVRAGEITKIDLGRMDDACVAAVNSSVDTAHERKTLLKRATLTEEISWDMDEFRKNPSGATGVKTSAGISATENARLDTYDAVTRGCATLSQMRSELNEAKNLLLEKQYEDENILKDFDFIFAEITMLYNRLQPREDRKLV